MAVSSFYCQLWREHSLFSLSAGVFRFLTFVSICIFQCFQTKTNWLNENEASEGSKKTYERDKGIIQINLNSFLLSESTRISLFILLEQWDFYNGVINAKSAKRAQWRHKKVGHICSRRRSKWLCANFTGKESRQFKAFSFFWFSFHFTALSFITHKQVITVSPVYICSFFST